MRLIDADKLRRELIMGHDLVGAKYTDMAATIEAISVSWLKEWASHLYYGISDLVVEKILTDWEADNGKTK